MCRAANNFNVYSQIKPSIDVFDVKSILVDGTTRLLVYLNDGAVQASTCQDDLCLKLTPGFTLIKKGSSDGYTVIETGTTGPNNLPVVAVVSGTSMVLLGCTDASCTQPRGSSKTLTGLLFYLSNQPTNQPGMFHSFSTRLLWLEYHPRHKHGGVRHRNGSHGPANDRGGW